MEGSKLARRVGIILVALVVVAAVVWFAVTSSSCSRTRSRLEAEYGHGVDRVVTLYSASGQELGRWEGSIDVEYIDDRIDLVFFDGSGRVVDRVVISPGSGSVVVDQA